MVALDSLQEVSEKPLLEARKVRPTLLPPHGILEKSKLPDFPGKSWEQSKVSPRKRLSLTQEAELKMWGSLDDVTKRPRC